MLKNYYRKKNIFIISFFVLFRVFSNEPLELGNPSNANKDDSENFLMEKIGYTVSYNSKTLCPNWVAWHLDENDFGESKRSNSFKSDTTLPEFFFQVSPTDYQFPTYGFDRGHVCPSADRTSSTELNRETFLMTNMIPQTPNLNRKVWMHLENFERELVKDGYELYIFAGPWGKGGESEKGFTEEIPIRRANDENLKICVPAFSWKIILQLPCGENDLERITQKTTVLAVWMPNTQDVSKNSDWKKYIVSIDFIEEMTGYDFFDLLDDEIEEKIEKKLYSERARKFEN